MRINVLYPKNYLKCVLKANSHDVQSKIYCITDSKIYNDILIENQIVYLSNNNRDEKELLLINEGSLIKIEFNQNIPHTDHYFINKINVFYNNISY